MLARVPEPTEHRDCLCPEAAPVEMAFDRIAAAVAAGELDAGVMIHEELLYYPRLGLRRVLDLGADWCRRYDLPLPVGLNVIRQFPIFNTVNFGSRTLDGSNALGSEWKYIPVRRTASYILRSLGDGLKWAVHQPNGDALWAQLRMSVNSFMQTLFRQGAFKGTSARDAYFVKCDSETTSANDMDQGIVNILVGFSPLKPAEFVVVSLRQIVQPNQ